MKSFLMLAFVLLTLTGCSKPSAEEMFNKALDAHRAGQYDIAIEKFQELMQTYPDSARSPEACYAIGTIYQDNKGAYNQAIESYRHLVKKYPDHPVSPNALFSIGYIYNNVLKNYDSARITYQEFIRVYPNNILAVSAKFELDNLGKDPEQILKEQPEPVHKGSAKGKKGKK